MPKSSHLTRAVFRAFIANRPYVSDKCLRRPVVATVPAWQRHVNQQQTRSFLDAILNPNRPPKTLEGARPTPKNFEAAIGKLVDLLRARKSRSRTPSHAALVDALKFLFSARYETKQPLTRNEVFLATETFRHLQERDLVLSEHAGSMTDADLLTILETLALPNPKDRFRSDTRSLAELVRSSQTRHAATTSPESEQAYLAILASTGSAVKAKDELAAHHAYPAVVWVQVLKGLVQEAKDTDFWRLLKDYQARFGDLDPVTHEELVLAFVRADRVFDAQRIYAQPVDSTTGPTTKTVSKMLDMLIRAGKMSAAESLARTLTSRMREDDVVASLILYHAARDPRPENLRQTVHGLLQSSNTEVSMATFNDVIEYALKRNNPVLAHAMQELALSEGFQPDGKTYALQLQFAIDGRDFIRAKQMYEAMLMEDVPKDDFDLTVLNRYIALLAFARAEYGIMMRATDTLLERGADLDCEAIAGLCHVFLHRGEIDEAVGLLRHRIDLFPLADRARVAVVFRDFIVDPAVNSQRAFNAYELFRHAFPETSVAHRLPLMQAFFDRKRPDMATQVFSHMRQADPGEPARPDGDAYAKCFEGIAQCRDVDGLQTIYNMLKLDLQVDLSTKIRNGIMLAHIACQTPWQAIIDHFYKIMDSREGPSYSTFEVAMRACETWPPYGNFEARKIIAVMQSWNLEITKPMYDNYVGVMAGQCEFEDAVELIENMQEDIGEAPDAFTIGTFYNAIPWQFRKDAVENWAKQAYPALWEELVSYGEEIDEEWEVRYFQLDRSIDINDPPLFADGEWKPELQRQMQSQIEPLPMST